MAGKKTAAEECCAKCESDVAALRKEIAQLKAELKKVASSGGKAGNDPRVDNVISALKTIYGDYYLEKKNIKL